MPRSLNLAANPLRLALLLLALGLLGMLLVGFNANLTPLRTTGSHVTGPVLGPAPNPGSQPAANATDNQSVHATQGNTRVVTKSVTQHSTSATVPAASAPVDLAPAQTASGAPAGLPDCTLNPTAGKAIPVCAKP